MKEIGGYIELDTYNLPMLHDDGIKLNCGRNALAYLIEKNSIKKILMPRFMCDSCDKVLKDRNVKVRFFSVGIDFKPIEIKRESGEWLYVVNYYGQLSNEYLKTLGSNLIVDNAQAYFQNPIPGIDTLYTCRKFFGVPDGAILYTNSVFCDVLETDESFERMKYLLGRFERTAEEFYSEYLINNENFDNVPLKHMSKLTENLLHGIEYDRIKQIRTDNFTYLHKNFKDYNKLSLTIPSGAFMYPFYISNGHIIRRELQKRKIYIPILWPSILEDCNKGSLEYDMAQNILPLPVDQRYHIDDMDYLSNIIRFFI